MTGSSSDVKKPLNASLSSRAGFHWQIALAWAFPIWWFFGYVLFLQTMTRLARHCGFEVASVIPPQIFYALYLLIPIAWGVQLWISSDWFRRQFVYMCMLWFGLWCVLDITQFALHMAFWKAMGFPIEDSLNSLEHKADGLYLPKRCDSFMNQEASMVLEMMKEKIICESMPPTFVYRLLTFGGGMDGPVTCYRLEMSKDGVGTLYYKTIAHEPSVFAWRDGREITVPVHARNYSVSAATSAEAIAQIAAAENYYQRNKYRSYWCIPRRPHFLLEFQVHGKYYYYDFEGREPGNAPAPNCEPLPDFLNKLLEINKEIGK